MAVLFEVGRLDAARSRVQPWRKRMFMERLVTPDCISPPCCNTLAASYPLALPTHTSVPLPKANSNSSEWTGPGRKGYSECCPRPCNLRASVPTLRAWLPCKGATVSVAGREGLLDENRHLQHAARQEQGTTGLSSLKKSTPTSCSLMSRCLPTRADIHCWERTGAATWLGCRFIHNGEAEF